MNRNQPIKLHQEDKSGTPIALIELARQHKALGVVGEVDESLVAVNFPFGEVPQRQTGCQRFVKLKQPMKRGRATWRYLLISNGQVEPDLSQCDKDLTNDERAKRQTSRREERMREREARFFEEHGHPRDPKYWSTGEEA